MIRRFVLFVAICASALCGPAIGFAADKDGHKEAYWIKKLAPKYRARIEVRLKDGTRVDLLSDAYAIEVDWAHKWAQAIGQSLYYGLETRRQAAIVLLMRDPGESRFVRRCAKVCEKCHIRLFVVRTYQSEGADDASQ